MEEENYLEEDYYYDDDIEDYDSYAEDEYYDHILEDYETFQEYEEDYQDEEYEEGYQEEELDDYLDDYQEDYQDDYLEEEPHPRTRRTTRKSASIATQNTPPQSNPTHAPADNIFQNKFNYLKTTAAIKAKDIVDTVHPDTMYDRRNKFLQDIVDRKFGKH
jgi:hypothetical protein